MVVRKLQFFTTPGMQEVNNMIFFNYLLLLHHDEIVKSTSFSVQTFHDIIIIVSFFYSRSLLSDHVLVIR